MSCSDLPDWYLRNRIAVLDVRSAAFQRARDDVMPTGHDSDTCLRRLVKAGRIQRIRAGLYLVRDPAREASAMAVASGVFAEVKTLPKVRTRRAGACTADTPAPGT